MDQTHQKSPREGTPLRRGWTTGACATAAAKAALSALLGEDFPDPVQVKLPGGQTPSFALAHELVGTDFAEAGIVKDAGDDPDVTHGATIVVRLERGNKDSGIVFIAGPGVGTVTKAGLPIPVGQAAINPVPRKMMEEVIGALCAEHNCASDFLVTISVPGGENIAQKTWNPRLGIVGGISILGTTGIVIPYSCSAWIYSIRSGIDVARAAGLTHIVGATGDISEKAARAHFGLPDEAYIDMGDFVGGMLKYLRTHPVARTTIAGGFAKLSKLAQGALDLHSGRSEVDFDFLSALVEQLGGDKILVQKCREANSANQVLQLAQQGKIDLGGEIARKCTKVAQSVAKSTKIEVDILVVDRGGKIVGQSKRDV